MNCNNKEFAFLGAGFPLYFEFVKLCAFLLVCLFFTSGLYDIITNAGYGEACVSSDILRELTIEEKMLYC